MKIEFSEEEVAALIRILDTAIKSGGIAVAEPCLYFAKKLTAPPAPEEPSEPPNDPE